MAASSFGQMGEFELGRETWTEYQERLGFFMVANGITDAQRQKAVLITSIGPQNFSLLRSIATLQGIRDKTYDELLQILTAHFSPKPSEVSQRFKFNSCVRKPGESVASFLANLRYLAEHCNFGDSLEVMLRDRLVYGINDKSIQKRLLVESKLTYKRAVELAQELKSADRDMQLLHSKKAATESTQSTSGAGTQPVHKVGDGPSRRVASARGRSTTVTCFRCGAVGRIARNCKIRPNVVCNACGKAGHIRRACQRRSVRAAPQTAPSPRRVIRQVQEDSSAVSDLEGDPIEEVLHQLNSPGGSPPMVVEATLDDLAVSMEIDTGASVSIMSEKVFRRLWPGRSLTPTKVRLCNYNNKASIQVLGSCMVHVGYKGQSACLPLVIVEGVGPTLFGRDRMASIVLDWKSIKTVATQNDHLQGLLQQHRGIFEEGLGTLKKYKATLHVDPSVSPRFCKARVVPYALRDKVNAEIDRLVQEGTLEPVDVADWAAPIVPVLKGDKKSIRICGDFRMTVNPVSKLDRYPLPKVEDLFAMLRKGKVFSKIDLSNAYQQLLLDDQSKKYLVINTQKGLFRYTRLPFGVSSAPGIFQRVMETVLKGVKNVAVYLDDILVAGASVDEHLTSLEAVFARLEEAGLHVKFSKCEFMKPSVTYLGHVIDENGLHPVEGKVKAIREAPEPSSVTELKSYLGLLTYYGKFLPNMSSTLAPLYALLRKDEPWVWRDEHQKAFDLSKSALTSSSFLTHFDPSLPLILACDASGYGIGAILSHRFPDGTEKPIGYASRTLNKSERNYSQIEKEGLSCIFGIKKFHAYLLGHTFELVTDHKPLLSLFKESAKFNSQVSARIKRWALFLLAYEYTMTFRCTTEHLNADALSRLPLPVTPPISMDPPELVLLFEHLNDSPVSAKDIAGWTRRDPTLAVVLQCIQEGWPDSAENSDIKPYFSRRNELSVHSGCILWGTRVVVPTPGRQAVLQELHEGHPGICRMKSFARMYVWWPGLDDDIEKSVRICMPCQSVQSAPPPVPLSPWKWPSKPWTRLHLDFAGPCEGRMFLVIIDAYSKWIETFPTNTSTSAVVIQCLRAVFARFGLPQSVVSDNGPCFVSDDKWNSASYLCPVSSRIKWVG